jgi:hypothetical protein
MGLIDGPATAQCPPPHPYGGSWRVFRPGGWLAHAGGTGRGGSGEAAGGGLGCLLLFESVTPSGTLAGVARRKRKRLLWFYHQ